MGIAVATCKAPSWCGRTNAQLPDPPTSANPSTALFADPVARKLFWLPDPPGADCPGLQAFWTRLSTGITAYRCPETIDGPTRDIEFLSNPPAGDIRPEDWVRGNGASRQSRSPNWAGATVHAVDGGTLTQVVGGWTEPGLVRSGSYLPEQEFRSSVWIGFNGHAAYYDAALPQIGTMQRIFSDDVGTLQTEHWVWFEWWANTKAVDAAKLLLPVYLNLDVGPGDTVLCSVEIIPGDPAADHEETYPFVARMCVCVEYLHKPDKVLVMPFIVHPPLVDRHQVRPTGSTANWIAELPDNVDKAHPFLMPRFVTQADPADTVTFEHCAAAVAVHAGAPIFGEQTLEVSRRFHMFSKPPERADALEKIATALTPRISDTAFSIQVTGNRP